jgi:hypothetical protein
MPRYELYDPGGPGPIPVASLHRAPSHEFYEPHIMSGPGSIHHGVSNAPSIHHYPSNFQPLPVPPPRVHPDASWEPIPDVHRESTIADPEAYHHPEMRGYDSEEERWVRAQDEHTPSEGYGRFVAPGRTHSDHRSVRREDIVPHHGGEGGWTDHPTHAQAHPRVHHPLQLAPSQSPIHPIHREEIDNRHHQRHQTPAPSLHPAASIAEQRSNRLSTGSGSKFQEHLVSPEVTERKPSLKKKISNIFNNKGPEGHREHLAPSGGLARSHSRAPILEVNPSTSHHQMAREASHHSQITADSFEEDWREDGDVYQYIVPPGVNIIFKDKHGNEITRCEYDCLEGLAFCKPPTS